MTTAETTERKEPVPQRIETSALEDTISEITPETPAEQVAELVQQMNHHKQVMRQLDKQLKDQFFEWLSANNCELEVGDTRYYVGKETERWCRDRAQAIEALLEATGGDFSEVAECISGGKSAWKYSKVKELLGDRFEEVFGEEVKQDTKTGKPKKTVREANQFTKQKQGGSGDADQRNT